MSALNSVDQTGSTPTTAQLERQRGQNEVDAAADHAGNAASHFAQSAQEKAESAKTRLADGFETTRVRAGQGKDKAVAGAKNLWAQTVDAYNAGAAGDTYLRHLPANASSWQKAVSYPKGGLTSLSFIAGHSIHNTNHVSREQAWHVRPATLATGFAAAAATWFGSLSLAGIAPSKLGFLTSPVPKTAGIVALPNLGAYVGLLAVGSAALVVVARLVSASIAKYQEANQAAAQNPVDFTGNQSDATRPAA